MVEIGGRAACPAGGGVERHPPVAQPPLRQLGTASRIGSSAWPRRRGVVGRGQFADVDFLHALEALDHDFHVGLHDGVAQLAELLDVLLVARLRGTAPA